MSQEYLDFELPIAELEAKIESLRAMTTQDNEINLDDEIARLQKKSIELTEKTFANLDAWQVSKMSRHPNRPYTLDYIEHIFTEFEELAGDRAFADDKAIVGGLARLDGRPVMVIGHQKGRTVKDKVKRNFGMPAPEGYRKALRLMQMAERFKLPIITFIDTPGAYPGVGAEERGQSEAIARNLREMSTLKVPVICTVIGEGGASLSGGEAQRISIARSILKDAPLIILDEATASIDADNEQAIQKALSELCRGKTTLVIAHRLETVREADRIFVIDDGELKEQGTHDELIKEHGLYYRMTQAHNDATSWQEGA